MSVAPAIKYIGIEEYLATEDNALRKHDYYESEMFAVAGVSINHNQVVRNTQTLTDNFLNGKFREVFPSDVRVYIEANTLFTYPDLTIFCDDTKYYRACGYSLKNNCHH